MPDCGRRAPAAACAFANAAGKSGAIAHHLAGGAHLGPEQRVGAGEAVEREHGLLDRHVVPARILRQVHVGEPLPQHHAAGELGQRQPGRLGHEGHGPRRARVRLDHVQVLAEHAVLHVHQPDDAELERQARRGVADLPQHLGAERVRRQHAGRVARVDPGLLDVLHDAADPDVLAVADRVDVDLDRVLQEAVEEDLRASVGAGPAEVVGELLRVVDQLHRPPAEHVARPHEQREADAGRDGERLLGAARRRVRRRLEREPLEHRAEAAAVLGQVDRLRRGAEQRHAGRLQARRELERRLAAELDDHALGLLDLDDPEHVLERERLEVEPVGGVVVRRDRLRVAVDHHRVAAGLAHGHRGVHAAVVELDPLADPVGPGAEDHHARPVAARDLVDRDTVPARPLPGRVEVRRLGGELGRAGVDGPVGAHARPAPGPGRAPARAARAGTTGRRPCARAPPPATRPAGTPPAARRSGRRRGSPAARAGRP